MIDDYHPLLQQVIEDAHESLVLQVDTTSFRPFGIRKTRSRASGWPAMHRLALIASTPIADSVK